MAYNRSLGARLREKYLARVPERSEHSVCVADFASNVARRIAELHPELLDPARVAFLAEVHDIGYVFGAEHHEARSISLLLIEGIARDVAAQAAHGPLPPVGIEGVVLQYADMSVYIGAPKSMEERMQESIAHIESSGSDDARKQSLRQALTLSMPRLKRYEHLVLSLADARSYADFTSPVRT